MMLVMQPAIILQEVHDPERKRAVSEGPEFLPMEK